MAEVKPLIGLKWEPKLPCLDSKTGSSSSKVAERHESSSLWTSNEELVDGLCLPPTDPKKVNKMIRKQLKDTTGSNWFDMPAPTMTPELKRDLQLLKLRDVMDPKKFYKRVASQSKLAEKYFQVGTVIEPANEFYNRVTKKNRKTSLAEDLVSDPKVSQYRKRKVREIEEKSRSNQDKKWKRKGSDSKKTKHRRH
ncbi:Fcf2 pre-rRNA processing protein [Hirschfeldia incana]|nr:Fcf2 pre-rRNA processing protein [Hirschfeldia incana]